MLDVFLGHLVLFLKTSLSLITFFWAIFSFFLGTWLGHSLARKRDKRKEFNTIADPLFLLLDKFLDDCKNGKRDMPRITRDDFRALRPHLTTRQCNNYNHAVDSFFDTLKSNELYENDWIYPVIRNPAEMIPNINNLMVFIKRR
ncbi:Uncharacterised protein [Proteus vulgaris]|uniref:hypothetical protein n=1 Tax=Proteus vulgaris TaxID=585 RepID=UPI000DFE4CAE|nr:hypothetical protein [Proteus vulgaris]SUB99865.1 Uncharacterised protein [Proteus vulgaris]